MSEQQATPHRRIHSIQLVERHVLKRAQHVEHERTKAIDDLLKENYFLVQKPSAASELKGEAELKDETELKGPYALTLSIVDNRLHLDVVPESAPEAPERVVIPASPFKPIVKDYFLICESYYQAMKTVSPAKMEAIDMGRRGVHNEGARLLSDLLKPAVECDFETARRLFTLLCVLHIR